MKIIVAGSRTFSDFALLCRKMDAITKNLDKKKLTIVSGHCQGADLLGEEWATLRMVKYEVFRADWDKYGKAAGPIRNQEMVDSCTPGKDAAIFFDCQKGSGTEDCLKKARKRGLKIRIIKVDV